MLVSLNSVLYVRSPDGFSLLKAGRSWKNGLEHTDEQGRKWLFNEKTRRWGLHPDSKKQKGKKAKPKPKAESTTKPPAKGKPPKKAKTDLKPRKVAQQQTEQDQKQTTPIAPPVQAKSQAKSKPQAQKVPDSSPAAYPITKGSDIYPGVPYEKLPKLRQMEGNSKYQELGKGFFGSAFEDKATGHVIKSGIIRQTIKQAKALNPWQSMPSDDISNLLKANKLGLGPKIISVGDIKTTPKGDVGEYAMEKVTGVSSSKLSDRQQAEACLKLLQQVEQMHSGGLIHGDLHDGNFLVDPSDGKVTILDWGMASEDNWELADSDLKFVYRLINNRVLGEKIRKLRSRSNLTVVSRNFAVGNATKEEVQAALLKDNRAIQTLISKHLSGRKKK